jgi:transposase
MGARTELRNLKRRDVVATIVIRQEPLHLVARLHQIPERTIFDWLSLYRVGGWDALKDGQRSGHPRKVSAEAMRWI